MLHSGQNQEIIRKFLTTAKIVTSPRVTKANMDKFQGAADKVDVSLEKNWISKDLSWKK